MFPRVLAAAWRCVLIAGFFLSGASAVTMAADAPPLILEHITTADGLPQATIYCTLQDSQGFIWLATEDGLVRYDGHDLQRYAYARDGHNTLPGSFIYRMVEDGHGDLWIALKDAGVARWERASDSFTTYKHADQDAESLSSDSTRTLAVASDGQIWIGTSDAGLNILNPVSHRIEHLRHNPGMADSLMDDRILSVAADEGGAMWIGTENGLDHWSPRSHSFIHYRHSATEPLSLSGTQVSGITHDGAGGFWVGTFDGGLTHLDRDGKVDRVLRHDSDDTTSIASDDVTSVLVDSQGHLWVGTPDGLDVIDQATWQAQHYHAEPGNSDALRDSYIMSLYQDHAGLVWIGTRSSGVSHWNPRSWEFGGHRPDWLGGKLVTSFEDADNNNVWVGSLGGGLVLFDSSTGKATSIETLLHKPNTFGDKRVMSLFKDRSGTLWVGTMTTGLFGLTADGRLLDIPVKPGDPHGTSSGGIMTLFESSKGEIWIGTHGGGANVLDPHTLEIRQLPYDASAGATSSQHVSAFAEDTHGNIWMGTDGGGLDLADASGRVMHVFRHDQANTSSLPSNTIYTIAVDGKGRVWVGTDGGGLAQAIGKTETARQMFFHSYTREQGLSSDTIYGIVPDATGRLWLSGSAGLMSMDPDTKALKTYHRQHGLQGEDFDFNAYHRLDDGRVAFGGPGGFNIFNPERITEDHTPPRIALTRILVMGVPLATFKPSWLTDTLNLDFRANIVTLDFGVLDYTSPPRNRIAYRMSGLTDRWIDIGNQRHITLTNLEAGDHVLEVRAANADSVWSQAPMRLAIHRSAAPWRSWWAYTVYLLVIAAAIFSRVRAQRARFQAVLVEQKRLEESARALSERVVQVRTLVQALPDRMWVVDAKGNIQWIPETETAVSSDAHAETARLPVLANTLVPEDKLAEALNAISMTSEDGKQRQLEYREVDSQGVRRSYEVRFTRREGGDVVVIRQDTSERTAAAERIERLAYIDTLTGLPNRQRCLETAEDLFAEARASGQQVAVLYLDLNAFKRVNDTFGHSVGDAILRTVANKLERTIQLIKSTYYFLSLSRFGGDEFVILLRHANAGSVAGKIAQSCLSAFEEPIEHNGLEFFCAPSVGIATFPKDGDDVATVLKHADTAMYHAKSGSSGRIASWTAAMSSRLRDWLDLEARLRRALQEDKLSLHFQPKFSLVDNRIKGVEALLRWYDSEHGEIPPTRFIEIAEESGLIIDIGQWVTRAACKQLRRWMDQGYRIPIAINVSPKELLHGDPARTVEAEAAAAGVPASLIEIEITESLLVKDSSGVQSALARLRKLGCVIALDDFGTGYSSLAYITRFPPDRIKIDKAFVRDVDQSSSDAAIANAILALGASLNMTVTAEGVEREGQMEWLRSRGCDEVQGFLMSRPVTAEELERRYLRPDPASETGVKFLLQQS